MFLKGLSILLTIARSLIPKSTPTLTSVSLLLSLSSTYKANDKYQNFPLNLTLGFRTLILSFL